MQIMQSQREPSKSASLVSFTGINSENIDKYWPIVAPQIIRGLNEGESIADIYTRLRAKKCQLWIAYQGEILIAACITEIITLGTRKVCNIISVGGEQMETWLHQMATLEAWARENECIAMRFPEIRKGWARALTDFKTTHITLEKLL